MGLRGLDTSFCMIAPHFTNASEFAISSTLQRGIPALPWSEYGPMVTARLKCRHLLQLPSRPDAGGGRMGTDVDTARESINFPPECVLCKADLEWDGDFVCTVILKSLYRPLMCSRC